MPLHDEESLGKPLISDAVLRGMFETSGRLRAAKREPGFAAGLPRTARAALQSEPEALLPALLSQLHRRDTIVTEGAHPLLERALPDWFAAGAAPTVHTLEADPEACAAVAAGMALRIADTARPADVAQDSTRQLPRAVVVALLRGFPSLDAVLRLIADRDLAVLLYVGGEPDARAAAQRRMLATKVPILQVDQADAVALCRVTQECLLRARNGWGGAVIHAAPMPGAVDPLLLLQQHLERRGNAPAAPFAA